MSKKQNILNDLQQGKVVNMLKNIPRYGTSMRSRISELIKEGHEIESRVADKSSGALEYFMPEFLKKEEPKIDPRQATFDFGMEQSYD